MCVCVCVGGGNNLERVVACASLECAVWVNLLELNVAIPSRAEVERHEKGLAVSSLTIVLE